MSDNYIPPKIVLPFEPPPARETTLADMVGNADAWAKSTNMLLRRNAPDLDFVIMLRPKRGGAPVIRTGMPLEKLRAMLVETLRRWPDQNVEGL